MTPRIATLLLPVMLTIACVIAVPSPPPGEGNRNEADRPAANQYGGGGSVQASWNDAMLREYAALDQKIMASLTATMRESIPYADFSAIVRDACGLLDDDVDLSKPDLGVDKIQSQQHTPEGRVAVWVFVRTGSSWQGYCDWHRTRPEPTPWPTPTVVPPAPLTVCLGWEGEGFDDSFCGVGGTSVGQKFRVKITQEGQAGWLEVTYPDQHEGAPDSVLCGYPGKNGFHLPTAQGPVYEQFKTCAEGRVEFRWVPDEGEEYTYQLRVANLR